MGDKCKGVAKHTPARQKIYKKIRGRRRKTCWLGFSLHMLMLASVLSSMSGWWEEEEEEEDCAPSSIPTQSFPEPDIWEIKIQTISESVQKAGAGVQGCGSGSVLI
jgi:hypothetical protein